jgi:hypothetical protein
VLFQIVLPDCSSMRKCSRSLTVGMFSVYFLAEKGREADIWRLSSTSAGLLSPVLPTRIKLSTNPQQMLFLSSRFIGRKSGHWIIYA